MGFTRTSISMPCAGKQTIHQHSRLSPANTSRLRGVLGGGGLAGLELLEVPAADLHVARVVVHALGKGLGGAGAVVAPFAVGLLGLGGLDGRGLLGRRRAAAEEAADGVANGRTDCYTAVVEDIR